MNEDIKEIAAILERAERSYGGGSGPTTGRLPGWGRFYAWRLIGWPDLPRALGRPLGIMELALKLERLDVEFRAEPRAEPWAEFYARELIAAGQAEAPG